MPKPATRSRTQNWFLDHPAELAFVQEWIELRRTKATDWGAQAVLDHLVEEYGLPRITRQTFEAWITNHKPERVKLRNVAKARRAAHEILTRAIESDEAALARDRAKAAERRGKREAKKLVRALEGEIRDYKARLGFLDDLAAAPEPAPFKVRKSRGQGKRLPAATYVGLASDWHMGERVRPEVVGGLNEYTPEIAQERAENYFRSFIKMMNVGRSAWDIRQAVLWMGGDLMTGYIHEELEEENFLSPTEESLLVFQTFKRGIDYILATGDLERLIIPTNHGNHGRTMKKPRVSTAAKNSFEWLTYRFLAMAYADEPRVEFRIANGYHNVLDLYGFKIRFHHGDAVGYAGGIGGLSIPVNRRIGRQAKAAPEGMGANLDVIGHFHNLQSPRDFIVNGSLIGWNAYADRIGCAYEDPLQGSFVVDERYRLVSNFNPLIVKRGR